jgi:hypothetical protein
MYVWNGQLMRQLPFLALSILQPICIRNPVLGYPIIISPYQSHKLPSGIVVIYGYDQKIFFVCKLFCYQYHFVALP